VQESKGNVSFVGNATASRYQKILWDVFTLLGIFTATCCVTLHRAGLNDWNAPVSVEYAEGNPLAILFFLASIGLTVVTGLLYRSYGRTIEALLLLGVLLTFVALIASKPHTSVHLYAFYATVGGAIATPVVALYRLRVWSHFIVVGAMALIAMLLLPWVFAKVLGSANVGFAHRVFFLFA